MDYVVQLLLDAKEARVVRNALSMYTDETHSSDDQDVAWKVISEISIELRKRGGNNGT